MKSLLNVAGYTAGILGILLLVIGAYMADIADDIFTLINKEKNSE